MVTISAVSGAGAASTYYGQVDDYYRGKESAPTAWLGSGAERLGLAGEVDRDQFERAMSGDLPSGDQLGRMRDGEREHRPGWDMTFSAPKSVSVAALAHGDERLVEAHDAAVKDTIAWLEQRGAFTRTKIDGETVTLKSDNLTAATFRHDLNREQEPQLHTHAVILNATQADDGKWRSLEPRALYRLQMDAGEHYRAALAARCHDLGYKVDVQPVGRNGELGFELRDVPEAERDLFSSRSAQVEAALAARGKDRATATAQERQTAALDTRAAKGSVDHASLRTTWRDQARAAGHDVDHRPQAPIQLGVSRGAAGAAVSYAAEHLVEREARFSREDLERTARREGFGKCAPKDISAAIDRAEHMGSLEARQVRAYDQAQGIKTEQTGFTTLEAVVTEKDMIRAARFTGHGLPISNPLVTSVAVERLEYKSGHKFNEAQRESANGILCGTRRLHLVQGYAGTAKTTTVLAASADVMRFSGYEVHALAPTHSAANTLGKAIGTEGQTVQSYINSKPFHNAPAKQAIIVDEASMLSAKDMKNLLNKANQQNARVILVGDVKQLGSVEAGAAFRQLQQQPGIRTYVLDNIVRQSNQELRSAVYDAVKGDASAALGKVQVKEAVTREQRIDNIVKDYTALTPEQREKTLVVAPGRDDRAQINEAIRAELKSRGEIKGIEVKVRAFERKDMTRVEAGKAQNYEAGDVLKAGRRYVTLGLDKGHEARVIGVDKDRNRITIQRSDGTKAEFNPRNFSRLEAYKENQLRVAPGDKLTMRETMRKMGISNGETVTVKAIGLDGYIIAKNERGKTCQFPIKQGVAVDRGFAVTAHQAQGKTVDKVIYHAESHRINLANQQSFYVSVSRAKSQATIYTDSRERLAAQIERESGQKATALRVEGEPKPPRQGQEKDHGQEREARRYDERQAEPNRVKPDQERRQDNEAARTKRQQPDQAQDKPERARGGEDHRQEKESPKSEADRAKETQGKPEQDGQQAKERLEREALKAEASQERQSEREQARGAARAERDQSAKVQDKSGQERGAKEDRAERESPKTEADLERLRAERQIEREQAREAARAERQAARESRSGAEGRVEGKDQAHERVKDHDAAHEHRSAGHDGAETGSGREGSEHDHNKDYGR